MSFVCLWLDGAVFVAFLCAGGFVLVFAWDVMWKIVFRRETGTTLLRASRASEVPGYMCRLPFMIRCETLTLTNVFDVRARTSDER